MLHAGTKDDLINTRPSSISLTELVIASAGSASLLLECPLSVVNMIKYKARLFRVLLLSNTKQHCRSVIEYTSDLFTKERGNPCMSRYDAASILAGLMK